MHAMGVLTTLTTHDSIIKPEGFYVIGFTELKSGHFYVIFLGFIYIETVLCNVFIIYIIWIDHRPHTPKYIAVANLGVVDLMGSTSFIPSSIRTVFTRDTFMSYNACLVQDFFYHISIVLESFSLSVLAYDRLIVICFPLTHNTINTPSRMIGILAILWLVFVGVMLFLILMLTKLSFCDSLMVHQFVCEYAGVYSLSCNDHTLHSTASSILAVLLLFGPLSIIVLSYACILRVVFRMKNMESRMKAHATCTEHLILVMIFYVPIITLSLTEVFSYHINQNIRMVNLALASSIPSSLNPVVYCLATKEIRNRILSLFQKVKAAMFVGVGKSALLH